MDAHYITFKLILLLCAVESQRNLSTKNNATHIYVHCTHVVFEFIINTHCVSKTLGVSNTGNLACNAHIKEYSLNIRHIQHTHSPYGQFS